jgi:hypothetical protein
MKTSKMMVRILLSVTIGLTYEQTAAQDSPDFDKECFLIGTLDDYSGHLMKDKIITHKQKTSFLMGAFLRNGTTTDSTKQVISIPNSEGQAGLCEEILKEFGCKNVTYTILKDYIPAGHIVSFEPSEEVGKLIQMAHHLLPSAFVYSQLEEDPDCTSNIENIFKVHALKIRHEAVQYLYEHKHSLLNTMSKKSLSHYFELISELPIDIEERKQHNAPEDSTEYTFTSPLVGVKYGERVIIELRSEEEMDRYIEQLNCTPGNAMQEYRDLIQHIKSEKERYLKCLDAELAKGDLSEYAKVSVYEFLPPGSSIMPLPSSITKINFLKVFKEFIFNDNEEVLPAGVRVYAYLKCGCKIP